MGDKTWNLLPEHFHSEYQEKQLCTCWCVPVILTQRKQRQEGYHGVDVLVIRSVIRLFVGIGWGDVGHGEVRGNLAGVGFLLLKVDSRHPSPLSPSGDLRKLELRSQV